MNQTPIELSPENCCNANLEKILDQYHYVSEGIVKSIISELKKDCKTYADLEEKLARFEKVSNWGLEAKEKVAPLFLRLNRYVQKEKNDLLITNRS